MEIGLSGIETAVEDLTGEHSPSRPGGNGERRNGYIDSGRRARVRQYRQLTEKATRPCEFLRIFGNEGRLRVLFTLIDGEHTVGELEAVLGIRQSALSQHLARLRHENVVAARRDGRNVHYSLASTKVRAVMEVVYDLFCQDDCGETGCAARAGHCAGVAG